MDVMLDVKNLSFSYKHSRQILKDVSFCLEDGEVLCLLGSNGTGKTTLLRCILSLQKAKGGEILLKGRKLDSYSPAERARIMAYVPQAAEMAFPFTAMEVTLMGRTSYASLGRRLKAKDVEAAAASMERLGILHMEKMVFNEMSGGERQMVLLARALAQQASLLIMDEPTANLDYANQIRMLKMTKELSREGYSIIMTTHDPDHAFLVCSRALMLKGGKIVSAGIPDDVVTTDNLTNLYNTRVCVTTAETDHASEKISKVCIPSME